MRGGLNPLSLEVPGEMFCKIYVSENAFQAISSFLNISFILEHLHEKT